MGGGALILGGKGSPNFCHTKNPCVQLLDTSTLGDISGVGRSVLRIWNNLLQDYLRDGSQNAWSGRRRSFLEGHLALRTGSMEQFHFKALQTSPLAVVRKQHSSFALSRERLTERGAYIVIGKGNRLCLNTAQVLNKLIMTSDPHIKGLAQNSQGNCPM